MSENLFNAGTQHRDRRFQLYHQHLEGHLDPRLWREIETPMRDLINARPGIQAWWRLSSNWFGEEFVNYVNQIQQTATRHDD